MRIFDADVTGSLHVSGSSELKGNLVVSGSQTITGSLTVDGNTKFGDQISDNHNFTGSVNISGSHTLTGSLNLLGNQIVSGSVYILNDLIVQGSSSLENITASAVSIGTNTIILNSDSPGVRYAGISVFDSGSTTVTASLFYDSLTDNWKFQHSDVDYNDASILIFGPLGTDLDTAPELVGNFLTKVENNGHGHHITTSSIFDNGTKVSINSNSEITGSLIVTNGLSGSLDYSYLINVPSLISGSSQISSLGFITGYTETDTLDSVVQRGGTTTATLTAPTFRTTGGNNTQFVKGDGSLDGNLYLTSHPSVSAASSSNNSGRTYIQDILLDSFGHITGITTASETVVDTNNFTTGATTNGTTGLITFTKNDGGTYTTSISGYVTTQITNLIDSAPSTLDTLNELAAALGDDPNFATTIATSIGNKVSKSGDTMTGNLSIFKNDTTLTLGQINVSTGFTTIEMYAGNGGAFNGYSIRYNKDATFDRLEFIDGGGTARIYFENGGVINAAAIKKIGGLSTQFLKADGSVDSSTYLTAHPSVSAAGSSNNSGRTYIQDILLDGFGHITGITTATETVTDTNDFISDVTFDGTNLTFTGSGGAFSSPVDISSVNTDTNYYVTGATFNTGNGVVTLTRNDGGTITVDLDGRYQATGSYLTGYTETDTLATVTARGNTTNTSITVSGLTSNNDVVISGGTLTVYESVSGATVFAVDGTNGRLFAVTDDLSNSLFSVSTISGLPVIEAFADYHIVMGRFNQNDFYLGTTGEIGMGSLPVSGFKLAVTGNVRATSFVKSGGTSTQFLKADGSVDSSTYLTAHPSVSAAASSNNSGRTYIQDILLDGFGHITGITTATETVVDTNDFISDVNFDGTNLTFTGSGGAFSSPVDISSVNTDTNYYTTGATFNTSNGVITHTRNDGGTYTVDIDGRFLTSYTETDTLDSVAQRGSTTTATLTAATFRTTGGNSGQFVKGDGSLDSNSYLTAHPSVTAASSSNNSGRTYIQDILLDSFGHITGITTASETVTDTNYYVTGATFNTGDGIITLARNDGNTVTVDLDGKYLDSSSYTASDVLSKLLTVDGATSGLDADLLDGQHGSYYYPASNPSGYISSFLNYFTTGSTFNTSNGVITFTRNDGNTYTVDIDGKYAESAHIHDDRYLPYEKTSDVTKNVGWYTIATNSGNRATGKFILRDTSSGNHQSTVFYATHHFGLHSDITVLINSAYSGSPFRYIRIMDGGTYDGALLQIYVDSDNSQVQAWLLEDIQNAGWIIKDWVPDGVDPGDVPNFPAMVETPAQVDLDNTPVGGIITTGPIFGGGNTTQYEYLNTNNYSTTTDTRYYTETEIGNFFGGSSAITGYNKSNWDTAFGWGNHGTQGYATTGYVQTQITNLIDGAPAALDTLNELAAALGDDPNFATTFAGAIGAKLPLSGGTMTGNIAFGATSNLGLTWGLNTDAAFIRFISTSNAAGGSYLEIGTQDDSDEEIKFTQSGNVRFYLATDGFLRNGGGYKYVFENGTWGINISGNAATVTNGVYDNGSYSNPAWITALAGSKITGNISGNASNITSYTINQNLGTGDTPTFSSVTATAYNTTYSPLRDKFRLWGTSSEYAIGMMNGMTYGGLNDYAMTFQFNNEDDRGFWWGDTVHSDAQGAMALTTNGYLTVARGVRVGYGESDTATPNVPLQVYGSGSLVFDVQGSQGQLFSVTDSLSGSLFSVNDISGLPILEVFSDDRLVAGSYGTNAFVVSGTTTTVSGSLAVSGSATVNGGTVWHSGNDGSGSGLDADTLDGLHASSFLTGHPSVSAASSVNNSGRTYIQDILLDGFGHITGITSATETVTDTNDFISDVNFDGTNLTFTGSGGAFNGPVDISSVNTDTNYYVTSASFNTSNGVITLTRNDGGTVTVDIDGKYLDSSSYTASDVLSKLLTVDGSGSGLDADTLDGQHASAFLTSYTETDTLNSVTTRGASTTNDITIGGLTVGGSLTYGSFSAASNYVLGADNIVLKGNSGGVSGIFFESEKNGTNINHPSDFGFIQYHAYGVGGSSGEANRLVIGVSNDADDIIVLNPVNTNGLVVRVGAGTTEYTVYHSGNIPTWNQNTTGNAATATYATSAGSASTAGYADEAKWISFPDGPRDLSDRRPNWNNRSVAWDFVGAGTANGSGNYGGVMTFSPWDGTSSSTGDSSYQLAFANASGVNASGQPKLSIRNGIDTTWNSWYTLLHSGNIGSFTSAHISVSAAGSSNNSGRTYIQDILLDSFGHITGITTASETVTDTNDFISDVNFDGTSLVFTGSGGAFSSPVDISSVNTDTNYYVTGATFNTGNGIITLTRNDGGTVTVDIDGKYQEAGTYLGAISYNNDSNSNYQLLWGSGNAVYGTAGVYVNPSTDYVYATSFNASDWFRSSGNTGWYNSTHGGGIYQTESTMVRTYDGRGFWIDGGNGNTVQDATLYVTATNNNDWLAIFNAYNSSKTEYGVFVNISAGATYGYALRTDSSTFTYRVDGSGRVYAPIYYDINDTAYYLNPASTSNLSTVKLNSTASGTEVFTVDGVNGRLFTITDDLSNSLFSVNTIAGVPVVEVFADNKVIMGRYNQNDLHISSTGEIGMGNTSVSGFKLAVTGNLRATSFVKTGGSSSQFLMADGSVSTNPGWITSFTDTNYYLTSASFNTGNGVLTLGVTGYGNVTVDLDGRYLESYTETDTLDSVLARGASTTRTAEFYQTSNTVINTVSATNRGLTVFQDTAGTDAYMTFHISGDYAGYFGLGGAENDLVWGGWSLGNVRNRIWHSGNDGSGSGLDADTLDGLHASSFLTSYSETDTLSSVTARGATTSSSITAERYRGNNSLVLNTFATVNPSSNVFLYSQPNDRDSWIYLDSADTGSNWGIYHRQIDSAVSGLEGNSIGFIGGGASGLRAYIGLSTGNGYFAGTISASNFSGSSSGTNTGDQTNISGNAGTATLASTVTINYNDNSNSTYQMLWGSGNSVYGTAGVYLNPSSDTIYAAAYRGNANVAGTGEAIYAPAGVYSTGTNWLYGTTYLNGNTINEVSQLAMNGTNTAPINITGASSKYITINPGNGYEAMVRYIGGSGSSWYVGKRVTSQVVGTESFHFYSEAASATVGGIDTSGNMIVTGSMRAPIFFDSADTNYFLNPNGYSNLGTVRFNSSGANAEVVAVDGVNGRLFTITDDMTDSIFSVNTISGLPVIEAFADYTVVMGRYGLNDLKIDNAGAVTIRGNTVWHAGNDGASSGLDADLLDGQHGSYYAAASSLGSYLPLAGGTMTGTITITNTDIRSNATSNWTGDPGAQGKIQYHANRWYIVADSSSDRIVQFRRNGTDVSHIDNSGNYIGNASTATTAGSITSQANSATITATTAATADRIVLRDGSGDIFSRYSFGSYVNTSDNDESSITRFIIKNGDNYHRSATTTVAADIIRGVASGTWSINVTGNAGTATTAGALTSMNISQFTNNSGYITGTYVVANGTSAGDIDADWGQSFKTFDPIPTGTPPLASPNLRTINIGENFGRRTQLAFNYATDQAWFRRNQDATWYEWREFIHSGNIGSFALTSLPSHNHDDRYFTETESDARFQPLENQRLSTTNSPTFVDIYANEWFRNNNSNEGLYNTVNGNHFYSTSGSDWVVTGAGAGVALQFRANHQSTVRGYVHGDTSNNFGLLDNTGNWQVRCNPSNSGGQLYNSWILSGNFTPTTNNAYDLGSPSLGWRNIYTNDLHLSNMNKPEGNDIDGTSGTWTIQEGDENLYVINNLNGKKYRIKLEEI